MDCTWVQYRMLDTTERFFKHVFNSTVDEVERKMQYFWLILGKIRVIDGICKRAKYIQLKEWNVTGAAISIFQDASLIYAKGFGMRDPSKRLEVNNDTIFLLASNTKTFTAMSFCILADEGKLDLDTPIKHYLPAFRMFDSFASECRTPRDLLTHRSGLPGHDWAFGGNPQLNRKERVELLHHLEPSCDLRI